MTNVLLIDLSSIAHPLWHVTASDPNPNAASIATVARVRALAGQPHVAICADSGRSFRADIDPSYKAQRPASEATLQHQIALAIETLQADGFPCWAAKGFEADDIIATATAQALEAGVPEANDYSVTIASADKDLLQLVGPRVSIKSLRDGSTVDTDAVVAKFGVRPDQIRDYLALVGDSSDNIVGAKGIGPKRAAELLNTFGTLDDLFAVMATGDAAFTPALTAGLRDFQPRLPTVRQLLTLRTDAPIPFADIWAERVPTDLPEWATEHPEEAMQDIAEAMPTLAPLGGLQDAHEPNGMGVAAACGVVRTSAEIEKKEREKVAPSQPPSPVLDPVGPSAPSAAPDGPWTTAPLTPTQTVVASLGVPPVTAVAIRQPPPVEWERQLEPRSMGEAKQLAMDLYASRLFSEYGSPPAVLSMILAGRELGLSTHASLRGFHIIDGKPCLSADLIRALILKSGAAKYFRVTERTAERATYETQRGEDPPITLTFTIAEGRLAFSGDDKKWAASGWGKNPADMCVARASAKLARLVYPDIAHGFYDPSELEA